MDTSASTPLFQHRCLEQKDDSLIPPSAPLPDWLTSFSSNSPLPKHPRTKEERELEEMTFDIIFETFLDEISEGKNGKDFIESDPRDITYGRFIRWVKNNTERNNRYEKAQEISAEVVMAVMDGIVSDSESLEDIERTKLRYNHNKFKLQTYNKRRYGVDTDKLPSGFGVGGITVVIGEVKPHDNRLIEQGTTIDHE